jgi:hypothetical protein
LFYYNRRKEVRANDKPARVVSSLDTTFAHELLGDKHPWPSKKHLLALHPEYKDQKLQYQKV